MNVRSSIVYSDIYGPANLATGRSTLSDQSSGPATSAAAGLAPMGGRPAIFWVGLVALLIALRVLIENDGR